MFILQIEHAVPDYANWKKAFDGDPVDRKKMGVKQFEIFQRSGDLNYVIINLWFESLVQAEEAVVQLRRLWAGAGARFILNPQIRILNRVEQQTLLLNNANAVSSCFLYKFYHFKQEDHLPAGIFSNSNKRVLFSRPPAYPVNFPEVPITR